MTRTCRFEAPPNHHEWETAAVLSELGLPDESIERMTGVVTAPQTK